jgi:hypothetical protein
MSKLIRRGKFKATDGKTYDLKDLDDGFYGHMTHESLQKNEDSVIVIGDGFRDSSVPKTPKTDKFMARQI